MHALPRRHGKGGPSARGAEMGCSAARGIDAGDDRQLDLRPRPSSDESGEDGTETLRERRVMSDGSGVMPKSVKFFLDGVEVEALPGETIWRAARRHQTNLPHLCFSPAPGYRADGNCRACMVEIEGERVLAASCIRQPTPGMKVQTQSERAVANRKLVFELLV